MTSRMAMSVACLAVMLPTLAIGRAQSPGSGQAMLEKSIAVHGGTKLTAWRTVTVKGTARLRDGVSYNAAFTLRASRPGRIRVDEDMTADQGRLFFEYFLHDGVAWMRRNLVVSAYDAKRMQRWLGHADGIAAYAGQAAQSVLKGETDVVWPPDPERPDDDVPGVRRATRIAIGSGGDTPTELLIESSSHHLIGEVIGTTTRLYTDFKSFAGVRWPTRILEITKGRQGDTQTPFTYTSVVYNTPIEDWVFTEDKPSASKH